MSCSIQRRNKWAYTGTCQQKIYYLLKQRGLKSAWKLLHKSWKSLISYYSCSRIKRICSIESNRICTAQHRMLWMPAGCWLTDCFCSTKIVSIPMISRWFICVLNMLMWFLASFWPAWLSQETCGYTQVVIISTMISRLSAFEVLVVFCCCCCWGFFPTWFFSWNLCKRAIT